MGPEVQGGNEGKKELRRQASRAVEPSSLDRTSRHLLIAKEGCDFWAELGSGLPRRLIIMPML